MKTNKISFVVVFVALLVSTGLHAAALSVIDDLKAGNARFVKGAMLHPHQDAKRRAEIAPEQHPKAIVLACADSRVAPEVLFDQGLGDLFVVRVAGNALNNELIGSIIYAMEHFHVKDMIVLGHKRCGAVTAAFHDEGIFGRVKDVIKSIKPAVKKAKQECHGCDVVELASHLNVENQVEKLRLQLRANAVGAYYDLDTGVVEFMK